MTVVICPLSARAYHRFDDRYWGAFVTVRSPQSIGRFCQDQTFALAELNNRLWSAAAAL